MAVDVHFIARRCSLHIAYSVGLSHVLSLRIPITLNRNVQPLNLHPSNIINTSWPVHFNDAKVRRSILEPPHFRHHQH